MSLLYGRTRRLTAKNSGFRPGQMPVDDHMVSRGHGMFDTGGFSSGDTAIVAENDSNESKTSV
jgi:hypothetical protein